MKYKNVIVGHGGIKVISGGTAELKRGLCVVTGKPTERLKPDAAYRLTGDVGLNAKGWWIDSVGKDHSFKVE